MKNPIATLRHAKTPEICEACGQRIDRNSPDSVAYHGATERHLPWRGKKSSRPAWLK